MGKKPHPAIALFDRLFQQVATQESPNLPNYFVPRAWLLLRLKQEGIKHPENFVDFIKWEEEIGLRKHVRRVLAKYHKEHGTEPTPAEKGAMRLERQLKKIHGR